MKKIAKAARRIVLRDPRERQANTDLGGDRDGYGRPLADNPLAQALAVALRNKTIAAGAVSSQEDANV